MKKYGMLAGLLLLCTLFAACGAGEEKESSWRGVEKGMDDLTAITDRTEYYDLAVEAEELFDLGLWERNPPDESLVNVLAMGGTVYLPLGTQFYLGEPVQLWATVRPDTSEVYLYRKDGTGELLLSGIPSRYTKPGAEYQWYLDQEGNLYYSRMANYSAYSRDEVRKDYEEDTSFVKFLASGEVLFEYMLEPGVIVEDICQLDDGRVYLQIKDSVERTRYYGEVDPATGDIRPVGQSEMFYELVPKLGTAGSSVAAVGNSSLSMSREFVRMDFSGEGSSTLLSLVGTSYAWHEKLSLEDFRVLEDGGIELLWTDLNGVGGLLERLEMVRVEKTPIVLRGVFQGDAWIAERVALFNRQSSDYHVVIEDCGNNDPDDFARLTSVQIGSGKGPDILCGQRLLQDYIAGLLDKGALEELNVYMEASGVREEDYFPLAFSVWRQGERIYGINPLVSLQGIRMDEKVLGGREEPDIETLADALLARGGDGVYLRGLDSARLLKLFLEGSENLWGMVDWEKGSCDFSVPLFSKLLEAAGRYGDDGRKNPEACIAENRILFSFYEFDSLAEQEGTGKVTSGYLFDDGCHAAMTSANTMVLNANSAHKEGAWEFIRFLLGEEAQTAGDHPPAPVNRKAFEGWLKQEIDKGFMMFTSDGEMIQYTKEDATEEKQVEYRKTIEEALPLPLRPAPLIEIILQEAEDYFNGSKTIEEVSRTVTNRVQLYLDENR